MHLRISERFDRTPPWSAAAWRRFGQRRSRFFALARSARYQSGARPPHSKEVSTVVREKCFLSGVAKDQTIEIGVVSQWVQVVVVLCTHTQVRLQVECSLE